MEKDVYLKRVGNLMRKCKEMTALYKDSIVRRVGVGILGLDLGSATHRLGHHGESPSLGAVGNITVKQEGGTLCPLAELRTAMLSSGQLCELAKRVGPPPLHSSPPHLRYA